MYRNIIIIIDLVIITFTIMPVSAIYVLRLQNVLHFSFFFVQYSFH